MTEWWEAVPAMEKVFWYFAIPFTVVFILQLILSIFGMNHESDFGEAHGDVDGHDFSDHDASGHDFGDSDSDSDHHSGELIPFQLFTFRNLVVFFTIFGWTGIVATNFGFGLVSILTLSIISGLFMMVVVSTLFYFAAKLTESGNINIRNAMLKTGTVYLRIPERRKGTGIVQLEIQGAIREIDAMTEGKAIPTGAQVRIVEILEDNTVLVMEEVEL